MIYTIIFAAILVLSVIYHILASKQLNNGGFKNHLKVEPRILVFALLNLATITLSLVINIMAWNSLLVWLPMLVFTAIWFLFTITSFTKSITPKDEMISLIAVDLVILASIGGIVLQILTRKA
jgi:hypothetical protein